MTNSSILAMALLLCGALQSGHFAVADEPAGCSHQATPQHLISHHCDYLKPRRIVIVTTNNRQDRLKEQDRFAESLSRYLRASQPFDCVISRDKICASKLPMRQGKFDEWKLLALSRDHNADAVLYCDLQQISAYEPMHLQASTLLVHVPQAIALVSATSTFDLRQPGTRRNYAAFALQQCHHPVSDTYLSSPSLFIDYAASEVAAGLIAIWSRPK
jgi:hypothetical protein